MQSSPDRLSCCMTSLVSLRPLALARPTQLYTDTPWASLLFSVARSALTFAGGSVRSCLVGSSSWGVLTRVLESPLSRGLGLGPRPARLWPLRAKLKKHTSSARRRTTLTDLLCENYLTKNRISERASHAKRSGRGSCLTALSVFSCVASTPDISGLRPASATRARAPRGSGRASSASRPRPRAD